MLNSFIGNLMIAGKIKAFEIGQMLHALIGDQAAFGADGGDVAEMRARDKPAKKICVAVIGKWYLSHLNTANSTQGLRSDGLFSVALDFFSRVENDHQAHQRYRQHEESQIEFEQTLHENEL